MASSYERQQDLLVARTQLIDEKRGRRWKVNQRSFEFKPRILDLFCCAGGAAMGYKRAGFDVLGVDKEPQKNYPFEFVKGDAIEYLIQHGSKFDAIHASPPCQRYSVICKSMKISEKYPDMVSDVRSELENTGVPWVIENVEGAPLVDPFMLCGSMFRLKTASGLWLRRHRLFETKNSLRITDVPECIHPSGVSIGVYGNGTNRWHKEKLGRNISTNEQREAMGIDWMPRKNLSQAIPPAYTEFIGRQIVKMIVGDG